MYVRKFWSIASRPERDMNLYPSELHLLTHGPIRLARLHPRTYPRTLLWSVVNANIAKRPV